MATLNRGLYIAGVGAACTVTLFDAMRNDKASALMKGSGWLYSTFAPDQQKLCIGVTFVLFAMIAALIVYTYAPTKPKEAFVLGAGILALFNASLPSPLTPGKAVTLPGASVIGGFGFIGQALAQDPPQRYQGSIWFFVDGPEQLRRAETRVVIFSQATSEAIFTNYANTTFRLTLPFGRYFVQIDHPGYQSVIMPLSVNANTQAYHLAMHELKYGSFQTLLGAENVDAISDEPLGLAIQLTSDECRRGVRPPSALGLIPLQDRKRLTENPDLARLLCLEKAE